MAEYTQNDFEFEEDEFLEAYCDNCTNRMDDEEEVYSLEEGCPECGGTMIIDTCHEGLTCAICGSTFDCWEDCYTHKNDSDIHICKHCYEDLEEE